MSCFYVIANSPINYKSTLRPSNWDIYSWLLKMINRVMRKQPERQKRRPLAGGRGATTSEEPGSSSIRRAHRTGLAQPGPTRGCVVPHSFLLGLWLQEQPDNARRVGSPSASPLPTTQPYSSPPCAASGIRRPLQCADSTYLTEGNQASELDPSREVIWGVPELMQNKRQERVTKNGEGRKESTSPAEACWITSSHIMKRKPQGLISDPTESVSPVPWISF